MATKNELLTQLSAYDVDVLQRLKNYADQLIIPDASLLSKVTMNDMIIKSHELADSYFPEWTDRSKSDFGEFMVELFAWFSEKDFWYLNALASQFILSEMVDYDIAYQRSLHLGYTPISYVPAEIRCNISFEAGSPVFIEKGTFRIKDQNGIIYSNLEPLTIDELSATDRLITFIQGVLQTDSIPYSGDIIRVPQERASITILKVGDTVWDEVEDFSTYNETSQIYRIVPDFVGEKVLFGDNATGRIPELGVNIQYEYYVSGFDYVTASSVSVEQNNSGRGVSTVSFIQVSVKGLKKDSLPELKKGAFLFRRSTGTILGSKDLISVLEGYPEIRKANSYVSLGGLYFFVVPVEGITADVSFFEELISRFSEQVVSSLTPIGGITSFVDLTPLDLTVFIQPGFSLKDKNVEVRNALNSFTSPDVSAEYGETLFTSSILNYIQSNVAGVTNVVTNSLQGSPTIATVFLSSSQIFSEISNEGSVTTSVDNSELNRTSLNGLTISTSYAAV